MLGNFVVVFFSSIVHSLCSNMFLMEINIYPIYKLFYILASFVVISDFLKCIYILWNEGFMVSIIFLLHNDVDRMICLVSFLLQKKCIVSQCALYELAQTLICSYRVLCLLPQIFSTCFPRISAYREQKNSSKTKRKQLKK